MVHIESINTLVFQDYPQGYILSFFYRRIEKGF